MLSDALLLAIQKLCHLLVLSHCRTPLHSIGTYIYTALLGGATNRALISSKLCPLHRYDQIWVGHACKHGYRSCMWRINDYAHSRGHLKHSRGHSKHSRGHSKHSRGL